MAVLVVLRSVDAFPTAKLSVNLSCLWGSPYTTGKTAFALRTAGGCNNDGLNFPGDLAHTKALADSGSGNVRRLRQN